MSEQAALASPGAPATGAAAGHGALFAAQWLFGLFPVFGLLAMDADAGFDPFAVAAWRVVAGALVIGAVARWRHGPGVFARRADLPRFALLALLGIVGNQVLYLNGLQRSNATNAGLMICLVPVFTFAAAVAVGQERFQWSRALGVVVALAGVLPLVLGSGTSLFGGHAAGNALMAANGLCYALYLVLSKPLRARYPALVVLGWSYVLALPAVPLFLAGRRALPAAMGDAGVWSSLAYVLVGPTLVAYFLNVFALGRVRASTTAAYILLQPVIAALGGAWILGERVTPAVVPSAAAFGAGIWLVSRRREPRPPSDHGRPLGPPR